MKCSKCSNTTVDGKSMCETCLDKNRQQAKKWREKRKHSGFCLQCSNPVPEDQSRCQECRERYKKYQRKKYAEKSTLGQCRWCKGVPAPNKKFCDPCLAKCAARRQGWKDQVYAAYGGYRCQCCGETEPAFLSIDHVDNNGADERRVFGGGGDSLLLRIIKAGFPPGYQVLCMNCQWGKRKCGTCPHQNQKGLYSSST